MPNNSQHPVFGLYFRRYAPFEKFGRMLNGSFRGDNRGVSTSILPSVTSRTIGLVVFNRDGMGDMLSASSGTHFEYDVWGEKAGFAKVSRQLVRGTITGPDQFGFHASTAGSNPLVWNAPDINTYIDAVIDFGTPNRLTISGTARGDKFPNLEVFLVCYRSKRTALLLDGQTAYGPNEGPMLQLFGTQETWVLARFYSVLSLDQNGELSTTTTISPTRLKVSHLD
jgi:hypothetical protein